VAGLKEHVRSLVKGIYYAVRAFRLQLNTFGMFLAVSE
jgi:hypothetical protein